MFPPHLPVSILREPQHPHHYLPTTLLGGGGGGVAVAVAGCENFGPDNYITDAVCPIGACYRLMDYRCGHSVNQNVFQRNIDADGYGECYLDSMCHVAGAAREGTL
eukprot:COSAG01_NODE_9828_length_2330_cov_1.979830_1_plen_106_part_00